MGRSISSIAFNRAGSLVGAAVAFTLSACGAHEGSGEALDEPVTAQTAELKNARLYNGGSYWPGAVKLEIYWPEVDGWMRCSGQVVSQQTILTAAHCLNFLGANPASTWVRAMRPTATGWLDVLPTVYSYVRYNPAYNGQAKNDVGLIIAPTVHPLQNIAPADAAYLAKEIPSGVTMTALGFGFHEDDDDKYEEYSEFDGNGRFGTFAPVYDSVLLEYIHNDTDLTNTELCKGDSGGPLKRIDGVVLTYGVASTLGSSGLGHCRNSGRWATVANNLGWLKGKITGTCQEGTKIYTCW